MQKLKIGNASADKHGIYKLKLSTKVSILLYNSLIINTFSCPTRIRTSTDRIKICCTTFILWDKRSAKVRLRIKISKSPVRDCYPKTGCGVSISFSSSSFNFFIYANASGMTSHIMVIIAPGFALS